MTPELSSQLQDAGLLLVVGMVVVFTFLGLLIGAVSLISVYCRKFPGAAPSETQGRIPVSRKGLSPAVVAAITSAVHQYRKQP
ncbi:OadG family transporter subunit [Lacimicrobium sp. SS2-24]|uniref:OadG family protein n=1 Tax=Lacimicrobium sp. SS2-24 TaxID=2005569 RepID=UPI000B4B74BC|nr:OadG family transporter subunit [Lacimicrobium sp. SS2-24]